MNRKILEFGGYAAAVILIAFGVASLVMGINGRDEVRTAVSRENIVGSPDMNKTAILEEAKAAGLSQELLDQLPTCNVAEKEINTGTRAKCFASYMRVHTFESTGGKTYSEMGRFLKADGTDTNDVKEAATDPESGKPVENAARNIWITSTALTTALNTSFFAEQVAMFSIVIGFALVLIGIGLGILAFTEFRWRLGREKAATTADKG